MIVKMKFLSITGPKSDIDRVVNEYLSKYEIQLENALSELKTVQNLRPYMEINPYRDLLTKANEFAELIPDRDAIPRTRLSVEEAVDTVKRLDDQTADIRNRRTNLEQDLAVLQEAKEKIEPFLDFNYDIHRVLQFKFIKYRFGRIESDFYDKLEKYVYDDLDTIFYKCRCDGRYIWGIYFVPASLATKIDAVYSSLHFERFRLPDEYEGTPLEATKKLNEHMEQIKQDIQGCQEQMLHLLEDQKSQILSACEKLSALSRNFDVRKLAACTKEDSQVFYILCGWMTQEDANAFQKDIANDPNLFCILEDENNSNLLPPPPTKLKNPRLFKPFEMFVRMYGLPSYHEIDPTIFVGLTYAFIFGAMFGDLGQGLCLMLGGALLYRFKKSQLAAIISRAGFFSAIFGLLFGSVFGFEDLIPALWLRPVDSMVNVPFIGKLNTVFIIAIGFGMFLILMTMVFHIINGIKAKDPENTWFDTNGLAGFVFYGAVVAVVALFMTGHKAPAAAVLVIMFGIPLLLIAFKEPLGNLVRKKQKLIEGGKGMFVVQAFFEMFEVLLSYFSNTLSFIRIGAFAVSHAAMMEVVLMLAGAQNGGSPNWVVVVLGNLFVCGMEGLIVGIQVLRLEYYEMFSRFYKGSGREFTPFAKKKTADI